MQADNGTWEVDGGRHIVIASMKFCPWCGFKLPQRTIR